MSPRIVGGWDLLQRYGRS